MKTVLSTSANMGCVVLRDSLPSSDTLERSNDTFLNDILWSIVLLSFLKIRDPPPHLCKPIFLTQVGTVKHERVEKRVFFEGNMQIL